MGRRRYNFNRMAKVYRGTRRESAILYKGSPFLGIPMVTVTGGSAAFGSASTFADMTVTLSILVNDPADPFPAPRSGTYGFVRLSVSGTDQGSFQLVEVYGSPVGPVDLNDAIIAEMGAIGWKGESTTFKINVKGAQPAGLKSANLIITDDIGDVISTIPLTATTHDVFLEAVHAVGSADPMAVWSPAAQSTGVFAQGAVTMSDLLGNEGTATATDVNVSSRPEIIDTLSGSVQDGGGLPVGVGFTSYSLSKGVANLDAYANTLASPFTGFDGTTLAGSWFVVLQGDNVDTLTGYQSKAFVGNDRGWPYSDENFGANSTSGASNKWRWVSIDSGATTDILLEPVRTLSMCLTRDAAGNFSLYVQEAGVAIAGTPVTGADTQLNWDDTARFEVWSNGGTPLYTCLAVVSFDDEITAAEVQALNAAVR